MTNEEAKTAFFSRSPVIHRDITYSYIENIIYWLDARDELHITLKLADKNKNSYTNADIKDVLLYDYKNQIPSVLS